MENITEKDIKYLEAKKRVKRIKGFYTHLLVYVVVNVFIISQNLRLKTELDYANIDNYWTALFWGVGLLGHGLSVFLPNFILGNNLFIFTPLQKLGLTGFDSKING